MTLRSYLAAGLVLTLLLEMPVSAQAQERHDPPTVPTILTSVSVSPGLSPIGARLALFRTTPAQAPLALFAPAPEEIRLSHGAKTAIIVTAIVLGALLIVGVVAVSAPGRHL